MDYKIDRKQNKTEYTYTPLGKLNSITYLNAPPDASSVNFDYDENERLEAMHDFIGTTRYEYHANNSIKKVTDPHGFSVGYEYDAAGNLKKLTYPGDKTVSYTYDVLNRLETVTIDWTSPKQTATYGYDDAGRLASLTNFNGTLTSYAYDNANRLTLLEHKNPADGSIIARYEFTELDGNGNRKTMNATEPIEPEPLPGATVYAYNAQKNRLTSAGGAVVTYDDEGQMKRYGNMIYYFNHAHQLESVGGRTADEYYYDGKGNRLTANRMGEATVYIYDAAGNLLAEANAYNAITRYYIQGLGLMAMITPSDDTVYTYHFNPVGSTVAITDPARAIVNKYAYAPFGGIIGQSETVPQPFKFVGQFGVMAEPNGLYYMRARYYDPSLGRFISEDPLSFGGGDVNLMAYVGNNPVNAVDPWGLCKTYSGNASYYNLPGNNTASGVPFDGSAMTGAMTGEKVALGTTVTVTHGDTSIDVTINDRGPFARDSDGHAIRPLTPDPNIIIDLTPVAFEALAGSTRPGLIPVTVEVCK